MNLGTHITKYPTGRFGFVGTLPLTLADIVEPTKEDIMAGRYFTDNNGKVCGYKFPSFNTEKLAREHAKARNVTLSN